MYGYNFYHRRFRIKLPFLGYYPSLSLSGHSNGGNP